MSAQVSEPRDGMPNVPTWPGGKGVSAQRKVLPMTEPRDGRPVLSAKGHGQGIMIQRDPEQRGPFATGKLSSPFPYYGGKSRWIDTVFQRIGKVGCWAEPCCGTAVMTLNNPFPAPREVICELNAYIANFYRSLVADYEQSAYWADWPTNHHDLTARHRWLLAQGPELRERMVNDPDDFDPKIAGYWCWGQSSWIGHGWCDGTATRDRRPQIGSRGTALGVQQQRKIPPVEDKRPKCPDGGGSGVSAQRDQIPRCTTEPGGQGVSMQRVAVRDGMPMVQQVGGPGRSGATRATARCRHPRRLTAAAVVPRHRRAAEQGHNLEPLLAVGAHRQRAATDAQQPQAERWRVLGPAVPHHQERRWQAVYRPVPGRHRCSQ